jgi:hypothetical protein
VTEAAEYTRAVEDAGGRAVVLPDVTTAGFREALDREHPDVLIFCGHGDTPIGERFRGEQAQALTFMNSESGRLELERDETIVKLLCNHARGAEVAATASGGREAGARLQLLMLNGCCTYRLADLLRTHAPPELRHILSWRTIVHDEAARLLGVSFLRRRLRQRQQVRRETVGAAFEGAESDVLLARADGTMHGGQLRTSVPKFAFVDPHDDARVDQRTRLLLDCSGTMAAGVPAFTDLHVEAKLEQEAVFMNGISPLLRSWAELPPSGASPIKDLREQLNLLEISAAGGSAIAQAEMRELVAPTVEAICAMAQTFVDQERLQQLTDITEGGNKLYAGIYSGALGMVRSNSGYDQFVASLNSTTVDSACFPQQTGEVVAVFASAAQALPLFEQAVGSLVERAMASGTRVKLRVAPLKHVFRVLQKHALRVDGGTHTEIETACDIVRGSVECCSMDDLLAVLQLLISMQEEGAIKIVRVKDRFTTPTAAGWADALVNLVCLAGGGGDSDRGCVAHVCELQLMHTTMLKTRKDLGGHGAYAKFREAAELLDFVEGSILPAEANRLVSVVEAAAGVVGTWVSVVTVGEALLALDAIAPALEALQVATEEVDAALPAVQTALEFRSSGGEGVSRAGNAVLDSLSHIGDVELPLQVRAAMQLLPGPLVELMLSSSGRVKDKEIARWGVMTRISERSAQAKASLLQAHARGLDTVVAALDAHLGCVQVQLSACEALRALFSGGSKVVTEDAMAGVPPHSGTQITGALVAELAAHANGTCECAGTRGEQARRELCLALGYHCDYCPFPARLWIMCVLVEAVRALPPSDARVRQVLRKVLFFHFPLDATTIIALFAMLYPVAQLGAIWLEVLRKQDWSHAASSLELANLGLLILVTFVMLLASAGFYVLPCYNVIGDHLFRTRKQGVCSTLNCRITGREGGLKFFQVWLCHSFILFVVAPSVYWFARGFIFLMSRGSPILVPILMLLCFFPIFPLIVHFVVPFAVSLYKAASSSSEHTHTT